MKTIVYLNGGNDYKGERQNTELVTLLDWKIEGKDLGQKYLYKGYRYYNNEKENVIVYDNKKWDKGEIAKRKANGFLGIKAYTL